MENVDSATLLTFVLVLMLVIAWVYSSRPGENEKFKSFVGKLLLYVDAIIFMILSQENKGIKPEKNPDPYDIKNRETTTKKIVFIRHGEVGSKRTPP